MMAIIMTPGMDQVTIMAITTLIILPTTLGAAIIGAEDGAVVGDMDMTVVTIDDPTVAASIINHAEI